MPQRIILQYKHRIMNTMHVLLCFVAVWYGSIIPIFFRVDLPALGQFYDCNMDPLLYPPYPKDRGMLWFYVEAARRPQWC